MGGKTNISTAKFIDDWNLKTFLDYLPLLGIERFACGKNNFDAGGF